MYVKIRALFLLKLDHTGWLTPVDVRVIRTVLVRHAC